MKTALFNGVEVQAAEGAPPEATCPACGDPVELRSTAGWWYYRHRPGRGVDCPLRTGTYVVVEERLAGYADPYRALAVGVALRAALAARGGSVLAALEVAFSPVIAVALDGIGRTPEELVERVIPQAGEPAPILVADDEAAVLAATADEPGPIFDPRPYHDGHIRDLLALPWYVPLPGVFGPARRAMVLRILRHPGVARAYGLGTPEWWQGAVGDQVVVKVL